MTDAALPTDPAGRETVAGEYVLGTLDAFSAGRVAVAVQADPVWRQAVDTWEARLAPLGALARPEAPPPDTWDRIAARVAPQASPRQRRALRLTWLLRIWAIGATVAALGLAAYVFIPRRPPPRVVGVLVAERDAPGLVVEVDSKTGGLRLAAYPAPTGRNLQTPPGRDLQIWVLAPGARAPVSMGLMPHEPGRDTLIRAAGVPLGPGGLIEISLEPENGSTVGHPSGPIVFFGRLAEAAPGT